MFIGYEQQVSDVATVKSRGNLTIPANATGAEIQADTNSIRYTMDNSTDPTSTVGMVFVAGDSPKFFMIDDVIRLRFIAGSGGIGNLNIHYSNGRNV